ncbi:MAG: GNAT family N-acetyltransferase [Bacteroidetes bacterium]|nr:GNAT family N-acetyltransferase [Bacteroidota bacterium]
MTMVILRPWQKQDAQELASVADNRQIWNQVRDALPSPYTVMDALQWIAHVNRQKPVLNFAIVYNGKIAGSIGATLQTDIARRNIEIGYFVGQPYWGKGIATEAVKQLVQFICAQTDMVRVEAHVFASNKASMKVLQKNGFHLEAIHRKASFKNNELVDDHLWVRFTS